MVVSMGNAQRKLLLAKCGQAGRRAGRSEMSDLSFFLFFPDVVCEAPCTLVCVDAQLVMSLPVVVFSVRV